jgi:hypothetical protein
LAGWIAAVRISSSHIICLVPGISELFCVMVMLFRGVFLEAAYHRRLYEGVIVERKAKRGGFFEAAIVHHLHDGK